MIDQAFPRQEARARLFDEYRARGLWGSRTFNDVLEEGCTVTFPDRRFIVASPDRPAELTFKEMHDRGIKLAGALHALGLRKGDVLAMEMPNWMEACLTYHACAALGVVVTPIIHIYQAKEVEFILCPNPIGHIAGIYSALIAPFMLGYKTLVLMDGWDPTWALQLIQEHRITFTGGATFFLATLLNAPNFKDYDTSSLREFGLGGAGVPPTLADQAAGVGWWSMRAYGCTEHPSITMGTKDDPLARRAHTDGRPMIDVEVRLVDDDGNDVAPGEEGEVISRGPDQFLGYMDPAMDADAFTEDGWFRTGDIGRFDAEGYLAITDRKKDIIIRGGENISAREVEEILAEHPKVQEAAVTPVSDERYGERVCAFVITRESQPLTLDEVLEHFKARGVAKQKTPERLEIVDAFPRTLSGKV